MRSHHLNRRTFLRGTGVALALPWMEAMSQAAPVNALPKRFCCVYWPFGIAVPKEGTPERKWGWFPTGEGRDFAFTEVLSCMEPLREQVTVIGGISHPNGLKLGGHDTGDTFLTGAKLQPGSLANSVSLDQHIAAASGDATRYASLTLSSDGGVGEPTRSTTLSFSKKGRPIPALSSPQQIYNRLFGEETGGSIARRRQRLKNAGSMLDRVLDHSKSLNRRLGRHDREKLDEYLGSVRAIEQGVERAEAWLDIPKPKVAAGAVQLDANPEGPPEYIRAMYDLMYLAFQTDSTRVATYMLGQVAGATTVANNFPACLGLPGNWHGLAHKAGKGDGAENLGRFDQFLAQQHARFLTRLRETEEGEGNLLDRTIVLYGSSNSRTHQNTNYPLLLAGGSGLGFAHGQYLRYNPKDMRLSNLYVTILQQLGLPDKSFADSTGGMPDVLAG